jgi:riboflavin kinase/FMN adenylyltransferase
VEAHLLDFRGDLYGRRLEIDFIERLRPTRAFAGVSELVEQIRMDVDQTRAVCKAL